MVYLQVWSPSFLGTDWSVPGEAASTSFSFKLVCARDISSCATGLLREVEGELVRLASDRMSEVWRAKYQDM